MSLEKTITLISKEILLSGVIILTEQVDFVEDEVIEASKLHRRTLAPGRSVQGEVAEVVDLAELVWTEDIVAAYESNQASIEDGPVI